MKLLSWVICFQCWFHWKKKVSSIIDTPFYNVFLLRKLCQLLLSFITKYTALQHIKPYELWNFLSSIFYNIALPPCFNSLLSLMRKSCFFFQITSFVLNGLTFNSQQLFTCTIIFVSFSLWVTWIFFCTPFLSIAFWLYLFIFFKCNNLLMPVSIETLLPFMSLCFLLFIISYLFYIHCEPH